MDNNQKKDDNKDREKEIINYSVWAWLGFLLGWGLFIITNINEDDASISAEEYLESLESNHDLNSKLDTLIEEFSPVSGNIRLGDKLEEYLGISLDSSKKQRLDEIAEELDDIKAVAEDRMSIFTFERTQGQEVFQKVNEVMSENIVEDNDKYENISLSFQFGKDYGWVVAEDYYQIFDKTLNNYASSYEVLNSYTQDVDRKEYQNIVNGVLKSCLCDIVLDENNHHVRVEIPNEVKELVKKK